MPKVKRPAPQQQAANRASLVAVRDRVATYAFGTLVCAASMVALAAWMGGSLGSFGDSIDQGFDVMMRASHLSVRNVLIVGLDPSVEGRARIASGLHPGLSMLKADPTIVKARVEALDAVGSVSVHRLWPDQITIIAETRKPLALWSEGADGRSEGDPAAETKDGARWRVIDQRGRAFADVKPADFLKLPRVVGADAAEAAPGLITVLQDYPELAARMQTATRIGGRRWDIRFEQGLEVSMPEDARLGDALRELNLMNAQNRLLDMPVTHIDARRPDRFALQPIAGAPRPDAPKGA